MPRDRNVLVLVRVIESPGSRNAFEHANEDENEHENEDENEDEAPFDACRRSWNLRNFAAGWSGGG